MTITGSAGDCASTASAGVSTSRPAPIIRRTEVMVARVYREPPVYNSGLEQVRRMAAPGERVDRYELVSLLGAGGMGEVYRALDTQLNRHVAVKFLAADFATPSARRRFQQEAQMASALNHPHILTVHEAGEIDGRQYLVTELVDGGTLADWAIEGERTWRQVLTMVV